MKSWKKNSLIALCSILALAGPASAICWKQGTLRDPVELVSSSGIGKFEIKLPASSETIELPETVIVGDKLGWIKPSKSSSSDELRCRVRTLVQGGSPNARTVIYCDRS